MHKFGTRLGTAAALLIIVWLIWQKLHFVIVVQIPWWGFLLMAVLMFFAIDYVIDQLLHRIR